MRRGSTPCYQLKFNEGVGASIAEIVLEFLQGSTNVTLKLSEHQIALVGDIATASLTQQQTLGFRPGTVKRQVTVRLTDGYTEPQPIVYEQVLDALHDEAV